VKGIDFYAFCYKKSLLSSYFMFDEKNNSARPAELCPWCADYSYNTKLLDITNTRQKLINVPNTIIPIKERRSHWEESNHLI